MYYQMLDSPIGPLLLAGDQAGLRLLLFTKGRDARVKPKPEWERDRGDLDGAARQLTEYFAGERQAFDLPLKLVGTPFQLRVWQELARIPFGETITYAQLARRVGNAKASRAAGAGSRRG